MAENNKKIVLDKEPIVRIGITKGRKVELCLKGNYLFDTEIFTGCQEVFIEKNENTYKISWNGQLFDKITFKPTDFSTCLFEIKEVTIGIDFHWEQKENQIFTGELELLVLEDEILVVNKIGVEKYLESVISSEMRANASLSLLKAHTLISRSWILNKLQKEKKKQDECSFLSDNEIIRWWENDEHLLFDVCADDHCQRYQGVGKIVNENAKKAVKETLGEVLVYNNEICDARFSKCCGGFLEEFQYCWEDKRQPYLQGKIDNLDGVETVIDLQKEENAEKWLLSSPKCFCNTSDKQILSKILNEYDQSTSFFRWKVVYEQKELSELIKSKTEIDFGEVIDLIPLERGVSGRISKLEIVGTKKKMTFGKELFIRKILSKTHLYSSAFIVRKSEIKNKIPQKITLLGAGWGHGVGLCQIGSAVMGEQGYDYKTILEHYYPNSTIQRKY